MIDRRSDALVFIDEGRGVVVCVGRGRRGEEGTDSHDPCAKIETPVVGIRADMTVEALGELLRKGVGLGNAYEISVLPPEDWKQDRVGKLVAVALDVGHRLRTLA